MLIKFFARGVGGGRGPVEYVIRPDLAGREACAPEVLAGNPGRTRQLIDSLPFRHRYSSGVISFAPEDAPSANDQQAVMTEFEQVAFAGLDREQYDILWVRHQHLQRTELHFIVPRVELISGKSLNIAPPGWMATFDPLRDAWNYERGWARPDDPARARDLQPRHARLMTADALRRGVARHEEPREVITAYLRQRIEAGLIENRAGIVQALEEAGLNLPRKGKDYLTVHDPETNGRWQLKGIIYHANYQQVLSR